MPLNTVEPLELSHSWPIFEPGIRFDLGLAWPHAEAMTVGAVVDGPMRTGAGVGLWECDLADNRLTWSPDVYDLFGLPRGTPACRAHSVALYADHSRTAMERLRAHAIRHRRGFTLDAEIHPIGGGRRWMRLVAAPVCDGNAVIGLRGVKADVSAEYR